MSLAVCGGLVKFSNFENRRFLGWSRNARTDASMTIKVVEPCVLALCNQTFATTVHIIWG